MPVNEQQLQHRMFINPSDLENFVNKSGLVGAVISISFDSGSGGWVLWFLPP
jgi:hypothetical protein